MLIKIKMANVLSLIENLDTLSKAEISDILQYKVGGFGQPTETKYLYNPETNITYTGLIPRVIQYLTKNEISYELEDERIQPDNSQDVKGNFKVLPLFVPRDYQKTIIDGASTREIIQAATGAGKTFIMANLVAKYNVKPVLVIAPKISLAQQIKEEFEKFLGIKVCLLGGGHSIVFGNIIVSTPQSCPQNVIEDAKMILFDEVHNLPADTIFNIASKATNAYYRFGVSATPWRDDGKDLLIEAALNIRKPHLSIIASDLITKQKLTPCTINFVKMDQDIKWQGNYAKTYDYCITNNIERNKIITDLAVKNFSNKTQLILVKQVRHGTKLLNRIKAKVPYEEILNFNNDNNQWQTIGNVEFLSGGDDLGKRKAILESVKNGFTKILIATTIADEGLDLPILDTLILAGAGTSSTRAFQRVGRVLRLYKGKEEAIVYDFLDSNPTFHKQALLRKSLYETEPLWKINYI